MKPGAAVDLPVWLLVELAKRDMIAVKYVLPTALSDKSYRGLAQSSLRTYLLCKLRLKCVQRFVSKSII